ncbi:MAG: isoprenylcysteine carboxylmethyltransferase family protein [archaeon]
MNPELAMKFIVLSLVLIFLIARSRFTSHYEFTPRLMAKNIVLLILFILYFSNYLDFANFSLNYYLRIFIGLSLIFIGSFLIFWAHINLGENWSPVIEKKFYKSKKLIRTGPYKYIRHPIYSASFVMLIGFVFLTANWFFTGIPLLILIAFYIYKIPKEEKSLVNNFGRKYKDYIKITGGIFPKLMKERKK